MTKKNQTYRLKKGKKKEFGIKHNRIRKRYLSLFLKEKSIFIKCSKKTIFKEIVLTIVKYTFIQHAIHNLNLELELEIDSDQ